jgi:hypothetical protein
VGVVDQAEHRLRVGAARFGQDPLGGGQGGRAQEAGIAGDRAGRQAQAALDAVLEAFQALQHGTRTGLTVVLAGAFAGPDQRPADRLEPLVDVLHVDDQVAGHGRPGQGLHHHRVVQLVQSGHAGQDLAAVDPHPAGAAGAVQAGVPQGQAGVLAAADGQQGVQYGGAGPGRHPELVVAGGLVGRAGAEDLQDHGSWAAHAALPV